MYLDTFRLARAPFEACSDVDQVYVGKEYQPALGTLSRALASTNTLTLVTGAAGSGKSTLIGRVLADLDQETRWSLVRGCWTDPADFLRAVALGFGLEEPTATQQKLRQILEVLLTHQGKRKQTPALIVEDAQNLKPMVLEEICWLASLKTDEHSALNVVLAGLPELVRIVEAPAMHSLADRRRLLVDIRALSVEDTGEYICHRLASAGSMHARLTFDDAAVALIHRLTGGIPGLVNTLCETAMVCASAAGQARVTAPIVEDAANKLHRVSEATGAVRVQGLRSTDTKAMKGAKAVAVKAETARKLPEEPRLDEELGRLLVTYEGKLVLEHRITTSRVMIGRSPENDVHLDVRGVSRYHAMLLLTPDGWRLIDLQSLNGTFVDAEPVRQRQITNNDVIQLAGLHIRCLRKTTPRALPSAIEGGALAASEANDLRQAGNTLEDSPDSAKPRRVESS
jgi:type II secretory pathway predicted ATPase ExeA